HGVNTMACVCAIDRATLIPLADYWAPGVSICGLHELVGNSLILDGEGERTTDLRQEPLPGMEEE
ncbi:MAG: (Fe-S)-binding protein, partial [Humidesulfovibrio sp.]|nr:(Fe-S)-binding protein [Humidesulfovibrio sp.]